MKSLSNGTTYPIAALAAAAIVYSFTKPTPSNFKQDLPQQISPDPADNSSVLDFQTHNIPLSKSAYSGLGEDYRQGSDDAKVVITEFADFECPACRQAYMTLKQLKKEFGDQILVSYRNYPLDQACNKSINRELHKWACDAAIIARCAGQIGQFWTLHDKIFENQKELSGSNLTNWAKQAGLSQEAITECRQSKDILAKIKDDIALGEKIGVTGTPALFVDGKKVLSGRGVDNLRNLIIKRLSD